MSQQGETPRAILQRLGWPVPASAAFRIQITFGDGEPPFAAITGESHASFHLRTRADEPAWSVWIDAPAGSVEIWEGVFQSNTLGLPLLVDPAEFPRWMAAARERLGGALSVAHIDAGRHKKAEPEIAAWLGWGATRLASARQTAAGLLAWVDEPRPPFYPARLLASEQKRVARQLVAEAPALSTADLRRVADRIVAEFSQFFPTTLAAALPPSARGVLADALDGAPGPPALHRLFLATALRTCPLGELQACFKAIRALPLRFSSRMAARTKIPSTPSLVEAARDACARFRLPAYLGLMDAEEAAVFFLLAADNSSASMAAYGRLLALLDAASREGRADAGDFARTARAIARECGVSPRAAQG